MKLSLSFVSLAAVAAAAPLKAAVWSKVAGGDGKPHFRIGLAGAESKGYKTPSDIRSVDQPDAELVHIMPFPMSKSIPPPPPGPGPDYIEPEFVSPPFVPEDMILPAVAPASHSHGDRPVANTKPCHGASARSLELSNWLRKAVGMPAIAIEPVHARPDIAVLHVEWVPTPGRLYAAPRVDPTATPTKLHTHHQHHSTSKEHKHKQKQKHHGYTTAKDWSKRPFADRLTHALMSLGRWEGRIVAFVLGCGIGVLLRLVWVMGVLSYRSLHNRRSEEDDDEHETPLTEEEVYLLPPPEYTNEKVALAAAEQQ